MIKMLGFYIRVLGGKLNIRAKFLDRKVTLSQSTKCGGGKLHATDYKVLDV